MELENWRQIDDKEYSEWSKRKDIQDKEDKVSCGEKRTNGKHCSFAKQCKGNMDMRRAHEGLCQYCGFTHQHVTRTKETFHGPMKLLRNSANTRTPERSLAQV